MPEENKQSLPITDFTPMDGRINRRKPSLSAAALTLIGLAICSVAIMLYLFTARAVIFDIQPQQAQVEISGLSFHIGDNFLLLPGHYQLQASAEGYRPLDQSIEVTAQATQTITLQLQPLPGNLKVNSALTDIKVQIDNQTTATVPGTITGISRGPHQFAFSKYGYFPLRQDLDIVALGTTQTIDISLQPAWGQMTFNSRPQGADLSIDNQLIGQTPVTAAVLETGSTVRLQHSGYKTFEQQVHIKAGTVAEWPLIKLRVSDGLLRLTSSPSDASVTIDNQFMGTTPIDLAMPPFKEYRLELFLEGHLKAVRTALLEPETTEPIHVQLKANVGHISFNISPADANILVDGQDRGPGSRTLSLSAKPHSVTIEKSGYQPQSLTVTPRPGHKQALAVKLLSLQQAYWVSRPAIITGPLDSQLKLFRPEQTFTLGAPRRQPGRRANEVQRQVRLQRPFYLGTKEISNAQFRRWREHSSSAIRGQSLDMESQPAVKLSWQQAALFCNWLSRQQELPVFYQVNDGTIIGYNWDSHGYRLPTEAEWAWAARIDQNGHGSVFPWSNNLYPPTQVTDNYADQSASNLLPFTVANYDDKSPVSATVGSFNPNAKGLYNMSGNVSEWVNDYYQVRPHQGAPVIDPRGPQTGNRHVIRGASWALASRSELRLSYRDAGRDGRPDLGFRIARYVDKPGTKP